MEALTWTNFYQHARFWRHMSMWIIGISFMIAVVFMSGDSDPSAMEMKDDFFDLFIFFATLEIMIYSSFYAYNKLIPKKKYGQFFLTTALVIILVAYLAYYFQSGVIQMGDITGFWANVMVFPIILFVAFGFKLAYHGSRQLFVIEKLKSKQIESELKLLKSQINPHFLFNTLNNIYSTNLEDHEKANEIILELSDLLRYQLESNKKQMTKLGDEISSLENYISLEKIRVLDCIVELEKNGNFETVEIVPLLLLPFVENAFKYGTGIEQGKIELFFNLDEKNNFTFKCKNRIVQKSGKVHSGGIGLDNVKKRLELMYANRYTLNISEKDDNFMVDLNIQL